MYLYVFNPEHDYALANGGAHFVPPASAMQFADDCALFLSHLEEEDGCIFLPYRQRSRFYVVSDGTFADTPPPIDEVRPWGWNVLLARQCREAVPGIALPDAATLSLWRALAHRRTAAEGLEFLRQNLPPDSPLPQTPAELFSVDQVRRFVRQYHDVLFKSPYSGNGRGHLYAHGECTPTLQRQCAGVLRKQSSIMGERLYEVVQDFAMEFECRRQNCRFLGYSLFNTRHYGYSGNSLCSDERMEQTICQYVSLDLLRDVRSLVTTFINRRIAPYYSGLLGVDMFIYRAGDVFRLHPMVEINLRMTMGLAAHTIYRKYVHPAAEGFFELKRFASPEKLQQFLQQQQPPESEDNRWRSGFFALHPVSKRTRYLICATLK